jgi:acetylornithine deacetylase/succinyl-diaminopimelate desuccinylase-like protein
MPSSTSLSLPLMQQWINTHRTAWLEEYQTFLKFPSVSSEPAHQEAMVACKEWLVDYLKQMHFTVEVWPTSGHPVIFAHYLVDPKKSTLLIYNHYDVQPVDPLELWTSPPFEPTIREGKMYARGAQDNKGQCFYVLQSLKMLLDQTHTLPLNIKLCIEGEEEIGSAGLSQILPQRKKELQADYLAIVDLGLRDPQIPALTLGVRGIVTFDVEAEGSAADLHSGSHGGIVPNPLHALITLLAQLRDKQGQITIPNFYSAVQVMDSSEKEKISFQFDPNKYQQDIGSASTGGEQAFSPLERAWIRPTLEINGLWGGYIGTGFKTVIPAKAYAKLSCRLVPDQHPRTMAKLVTNYLQTHAPAGVKVTVTAHAGGGEAVRMSPDSVIVKKFAQALENVFGVPCEYILAGGSIPIVPELAAASGAEVILLGLGLDTDQIHAPNEHFGIDRLEKGMLMMAQAMQLLA